MMQTAWKVWVLLRELSGVRSIEEMTIYDQSSRSGWTRGTLTLDGQQDAEVAGEEQVRASSRANPSPGAAGGWSDAALDEVITPELRAVGADTEAIEAARRIVEADDQYNNAPRLKKAWAWDMYKEEAIVCAACVARALLARQEGAREAVIDPYTREECAKVADERRDANADGSWNGASASIAAAIRSLGARKEK